MRIAAYLYIDQQNLSLTDDKPMSSPQVEDDGLFRFKVLGDADTFKDFYLNHIGNELFFYRGFNCSHFSYPEMQAGQLKSEGDADLPMFTMGNSEDTKTRWLPGCFDKDLAAGVGISGTDPFTMEIGEKAKLPIAVTVKVDVGLESERRICWLNSGEQVLQGPLAGDEFRICSMLWMENGQFSQNICDLAYNQLPPPRPYEPTKEQIDEWWPICQQWIEEHYAVHQ